MFTKEEYVDWRNNKITRLLVASLVKNRTDRLEEIADGKTEGVQGLYTEIGACQGIKDAVSFLYNQNGELMDLFIEEDNGKETA